MTVGLLCSQFNQRLSLAIPQKTDRTSQLQTQLSASTDTGIQVAAREPTQCPKRAHSSPLPSSQLTGSEEGNHELWAWQRGRRLLLTACLPVYMGSGKTVNFSHRGDKWENQKRQGVAAWKTASERLLEARQGLQVCAFVRWGRGILGSSPKKKTSLQKDALRLTVQACLTCYSAFHQSVPAE